MPATSPTPAPQRNVQDDLFRVDNPLYRAATVKQDSYLTVNDAAADPDTSNLSAYLSCNTEPEDLQ
eukprot:m.337227 g.337227  ORF g.337227 m.337227 type:complete len:66 (+) comp114087_c0_seq1:1-198(+)